MKTPRVIRVAGPAVVAVIAYFVTGCVTVARPGDLDEYMVNRMDRAGVPGMAIGVMRDGELIDQRAYGVADAKSGRRVDQTTRFMIASISKPVTATAMMILYERGSVDIDRPVNEYLPFEIVNPNYPNREITIRMLLTHTSSIEDNYDAYDSFDTLPEGGDPDIPLAELIPGYFLPGGMYYDETHNFSREAPGTNHSYSNMGYALVGYVVEVVSDTPFDLFCEREIFAPLGMSDTDWFLGDSDRSRIAVPHSVDASGFTPLPHYGFASYPDGQLRTTVSDYAAFMRMLMRPAESGILQQETVDHIFRIQFPDVHSTQAIAWNYEEFEMWIVYRRLPRVPSHSGGDSGIATAGMFDPESGSGIIVFANGLRPKLRTAKYLYLDILKRLSIESGLL